MRHICCGRVSVTRLVKIAVTLRHVYRCWLYVVAIELLDIECVLCHVTGVQFDKKICPYKSTILDFLQK